MSYIGKLWLQATCRGIQIFPDDSFNFAEKYQANPRGYQEVFLGKFKAIS